MPQPTQLGQDFIDLCVFALSFGVATFAITKAWRLLKRWTYDPAPYEGRIERWADMHEDEKRQRLTAILERDRQRYAPVNPAYVDVDEHGLPHAPVPAQAWDELEQGADR